MREDIFETVSQRPEETRQAFSEYLRNSGKGLGALGLGAAGIYLGAKGYGSEAVQAADIPHEGAEEFSGEVADTGLLALGGLNAVYAANRFRHGFSNFLTVGRGIIDKLYHSSRGDDS